MTEPDGAVATARRGRPRPEETKQRDEQVLSALTEPLTRASLATKIDMAPNDVYLSLWRLRRDGKVQRTRDGGSHLWSRVEAVPQ